MDSIPLAIPYPWSDSDTQALRILTRKRQGAGWNYVQNKRGCGASCKRILEQYLLVNTAPETQDTSHLASSSFFVFGKTPIVADEGDDVVQLAQDGTVSLLLTILKQLEEASTSTTGSANHLDGGLSTTDLIRSCALAVHPASTPGNYNAKEMVIAALLFLSSSLPTDNDDDDDEIYDSSSISLRLPLIETDNPHDDVEQRIYRKVNTISQDDPYTMESLAELQLIFDSSPLARDKFVPLCLGDNETELLTTGNPPAHAIPKRKGPAPGYRRKSKSDARTTTDGADT